jgi:hypothetical protein
MKYNFIIPYRNRKGHLDEFIKRFSGFIVNKNIDVQFFVIHQMHPGPFNRGAMKNIGFLEVHKTRPDGLFIFHDIDLYPTYWGSIDYSANPGEIKHSIGIKGENLGGICCFWKNEFEQINGFPNYWGWGIEDVTLLYRAKRHNIPINETNCVSLDDKQKCFIPIHTRDATKEDEYAKINTALHFEELKSGQETNGLSNIKYQILSTLDLAPHFKLINVDFNLE